MTATASLEVDRLSAGVVVAGAWGGRPALDVDLGHMMTAGEGRLYYVLTRQEEEARRHGSSAGRHRRCWSGRKTRWVVAHSVLPAVAFERKMMSIVAARAELGANLEAAVKEDSGGSLKLVLRSAAASVLLAQVPRSYVKGQLPDVRCLQSMSHAGRASGLPV